VVDLSTAFYAWYAATANMRNWSPLAASDVDFALVAELGEWQKVQPCWLMMYYTVPERRIQFTSGCSACPSPFDYY
jgi:hypothetical protein